MKVTLFLPLAVVMLGTTSPLGADSPVYFPIEKIEYSIKNLGVKAGNATLEFLANQVLEGKAVHRIVFTANGFNFYDQERIYIDPETYYPLRVVRDLNIFGKKEKITEYYNASAGYVKIVKDVGGHVTEQTIQKKGNIDNIYCFIYRYRKEGKFTLGDTFQIHLPTKDVEITLVQKKKLKAAGEAFEAYFMQSNPKEYRVWFDSGERKLPLRIDGAVGFGNTSMLIKDVKKKDSGAAPGSEG